MIENGLLVHREDIHLQRHVFLEGGGEHKIDPLLCHRPIFGALEDPDKFDLPEAGAVRSPPRGWRFDRFLRKEHLKGRAGAVGDHKRPFAPPPAELGVIGGLPVVDHLDVIVHQPLPVVQVAFPAIETHRGEQERQPGDEVAGFSTTSRPA